MVATTCTIQTDWDKLANQKGLKTEVENRIEVTREAIPIIFVPGIMGTRLESTETGKLVWNPSSKFFMVKNYFGRSASTRRKALVGDSGYGFSSGYLQVHKPLGDKKGFEQLYSNYMPFLEKLEKTDWGPLSKLFEFPVYAVGYNWTNTNRDNGRYLASEIKRIIKEAKEITGACKKVILITHSMGGLVSRSACKLHGAESDVLGIIHGVQPATGAATAFRRVKTGFELAGGGLAKVTSFVGSYVLGFTGKEVTPLFGNLPGCLELLPNQLYKDNNGSEHWLKFSNGKDSFELPKGKNPYKEIYNIPSIGVEDSAFPDRKVWSLIDPDLLDPHAKTGLNNAKNSKDRRAAAGRAQSGKPWSQYRYQLIRTEGFHLDLADKHHANSYNIAGVGHTTIDRIDYTCSIAHAKGLAARLSDPASLHNLLTKTAPNDPIMRVLRAALPPEGRALLDAFLSTRDSIAGMINEVPRALRTMIAGVMNYFLEPYQHRAFTGYFRDPHGRMIAAELEKGSGEGDGTVPISSAVALNKFMQASPAPAEIDAEHEPAYKEKKVQDYTHTAILNILEQYITKQTNAK